MAEQIDWTDEMLLAELKKCAGGREPFELQPGEVIDIPAWLADALEQHTGITPDYAEAQYDD